MSLIYRPRGLTPVVVGACLMLPSVPVTASEEEREEDCLEQQTDCTSSAVEISRIRVEVGQTELKAGESTYGRELLETLPTGSGNLSDLLRINPATDFSRESSHSGQCVHPPWRDIDPWAVVL